MGITRAVALFIAAGPAQTGGGYLVWRWLREGAPVIAGVLPCGRAVNRQTRPATFRDRRQSASAPVAADMHGNLVAQTVGSRHAELDLLRPVIGAA